MSTDDETGAQQAESEEELVPVPLIPIDIPDHEELEREVFRRIIALGDLAAGTNAKVEKLTRDVAELQRGLEGLARMVAKTPDGETLINLVMQIRAKVEKL